MAVLYLDTVNGNDANDGTSFALRKKTLTGFASPLPGDVIRIIASPAAYSPGSATWTDNSGTVTWAAAKNKVIDDCETNWTAAANVTCALETSIVKQGTNSQKITPATAFTTGKLAYRTLPATLDLSAFEQVSLWLRYGSSATAAAGALEIKLCSDTTGDTPVDTLACPVGTAGQWRSVVLDKAAALGSSIASIALYATVDPATTPIYLDNIVACKASASTDCVTHEHVIGKNTGGEPDWYGIQSIGDDTVILGGSRETLSPSATNPLRPYRGTSESVATYVMTGLPAMATADRILQNSGSLGSQITLSGGWNRTDMSTQTGVTYFNGSRAFGSALNIGAQSHVATEKIGGMYLITAVVEGTNASSFDISIEQAIACSGGPVSINSPAGTCTITFDAVYGSSATASFVNAGATNKLRLKGRRIHAASQTGAALTLYPDTTCVLDQIDNNPGTGLTTHSSNLGRSAILHGTTFSNNVVGDVLGSMVGAVIANDCTLTPPTELTSGPRDQLRLTRLSGGANDHRIIADSWRAQSATDQRHTASGVSWKFNPLNATGCTSREPALLPLAKVAVNASALVTVKVWARRNDTGLSLGLFIPANSLPGVGNSDLKTLMTAAVDTWEEITLTFTPTQAGVVEVFGMAYGGTSLTGWLDDLSITQ